MGAGGRRISPVAWVRLSTLGASAAFWVVLLILYFGALTIASAYPGPLLPYSTSKDTTVLVETEACRQDGPISDSGFGYWWTCSATIRYRDGRTVAGELHGSIVTPRDQGRQVTLVEACGSWDRCSIGRPGYGGWMIPMALLTYVLGILIAGAFVMSCVSLARAILGPPRRPTLRARRRITWS